VEVEVITASPPDLLVEVNGLLEEEAFEATAEALEAIEEATATAVVAAFEALKPHPTQRQGGLGSSLDRRLRLLGVGTDRLLEGVNTCIRRRGIVMSRLVLRLLRVKAREREEMEGRG
jgi:hypothetical protein